MKTKIFISLLLSIFFLSSCKNESKEQENKVVEEQTFNITLEATVKKDDNFQVYYTENQSESFNEDKSVWVEVKGSETPQKINFKLPKDVVPMLVRLDFGLNKNQDNIVLSSVEMEYFGKKFSTKGESMMNYFRSIEPTKIDFSTGIINAIDKNGVRAEPVLYPHEIPLGKEIEKIVK